MAILRHQPLVWAPVGGLTVQLSLLGMVLGLRRIRRQERSLLPNQQTPWQALSTFVKTLIHSIQGTIYMFHWVPIIASTAVRMSIRPKRLKWVKTAHHGTDDLELNLSE
jgi:1,2-diacylglycerol 3-beta-glucosyltransferase